ncbi:unnamed protein product [Heligmosomoides polygyrus]|uniref:Uncharacterized protein n=1 Tax=Heligmosomoides polygyrus TaxID=6339 RepID=A0A183GWZ8_HELPZ|nr:unnamed protein product [Heligmosomoides polygyrus]
MLCRSPTIEMRLLSIPEGERDARRGEAEARRVDAPEAGSTRGLQFGLRSKAPGPLPDRGARQNRYNKATGWNESNSKSFHMEYYVENGVFVGSGTEVINKAISICAPIRAPLQSEESWQRAETPRNPMIINKNRLMQQEARNVE